MNFPEKVIRILKTLLIYWISMKYIIFGIPKLLHMQFKVAHYKAYTPLAELSKYDHMWSFFGRSYNYNLFIGLIEIMIGVLIVFKRTRLIALLILFGVSLNILILNVEFEIKFAIYHVAFDFVSCILLLLPYLSELKKFFIVNGGRINFTEFRNVTKFQKVFPIVFLMILCFGYFIFSVFIKNKYISELEGTYIIEKIEINGIEKGFNKGKIGSKPMFFIENAHTIVLSLNDTVIFGSTVKKNGIWNGKFIIPLSKDTVRAIITDTQIIGELINSTNEKNNDSINIYIQRMKEKDNYLNSN